MTGSPVHWVSAFIDAPPDRFDVSAAFWATVTDSRAGRAVGDRDEFVPLEAPHGDPCLWLQRTDDGPVGCHPDLYVKDVDAVAAKAVELGATRLSVTDGLVVLTSPGLLPFCLVTYRGQSVRPEPVGPSGTRSVVDQICLDIPPDRIEGECDFWSGLTGWPRWRESHDEFDRLARPPGIPYAFLLQRLDEEQPAVRAHLDLACDDRDAVTAQHEAQGADVVRRTAGWTVMRDPAGMVYCATTRAPGEV
jgi:hypothetical protein